MSFGVSGFSLSRKMAHLSDDKTVAKMGSPDSIWATAEEFMQIADSVTFLIVCRCAAKSSLRKVVDEISGSLRCRARIDSAGGLAGR